jgi:tRNA G18 (ribose-2'-O)-methylase SpoU
MDLILYNIRSVQNVGAIFRTADGAGVKHIYLAGYTPHPIDRFGRVRADLAKTALGAEVTMSWSHSPDVLKLIAELRGGGSTIVAVEQCRTALSITDFVPPVNVTYIVGNEVKGVPAEVCTLADVVIEIPMLGRKESLNVSVATGIVLYHGVICGYKKSTSN